MNTPQEQPIEPTRRCYVCKKRKPESAFYRNQYKCKECDLGLTGKGSPWRKFVKGGLNADRRQ